MMGDDPQADLVVFEEKHAIVGFGLNKTHALFGSVCVVETNWREFFEIPGESMFKSNMLILESFLMPVV